MLGLYWLLLLLPGWAVAVRLPQRRVHCAAHALVRRLAAALPLLQCSNILRTFMMMMSNCIVPQGQACPCQA